VERSVPTVGPNEVLFLPPIAAKMDFASYSNSYDIENTSREHYFKTILKLYSIYYDVEYSLCPYAGGLSIKLLERRSLFRG
jgi:hypothetical protein